MPSEEKTFTGLRLKARATLPSLSLDPADPQVSHKLPLVPAPSIRYHRRQPQRAGRRRGRGGECSCSDSSADCSCLNAKTPLSSSLALPPPCIRATIYPAKEQLESHQECTLIGLRGLQSSRRQALPAGAESTCLHSTGMQFSDNMLCIIYILINY